MKKLGIIAGVLLLIGAASGNAMEGMTCKTMTGEMTCEIMTGSDHTACMCDMSSQECMAMCMDHGCTGMGMEALIDISPGKLNLRSNGGFITAYIEFDDDDYLYDIDPASIKIKKINGKMAKLNGEHLTATGNSEINDYDENGVLDLMVKFSRQDLISLLLESGIDTEEVEISLSGNFSNTSGFNGKDTLRIK